MSARTTARAPPSTHPIALNEEWTMSVAPGVTPRSLKSRASRSMPLADFMTSIEGCGRPQANGTFVAATTSRNSG